MHRRGNRTDLVLPGMDDPPTTEAPRRRLGALFHRGQPPTAWAWLGAGADDAMLTRWLFLRLLALVYFLAFASLWPQVRGLIGGHGILPAVEYLRTVAALTGAERYHLVPTLAWLSASDAFLRFLCGGGIVLALLLLADLLPAATLALLWLFYLSLVSVGQDFLSFQWDVLLLEAGFLAIFLAPTHILPRRAEAPPPRVVLWLLRLLIFRLMLSSGLVKLASGDPTWRDLTALAYHYWTQPLPTPLAWYANQLPLEFQRFSAGVMLAVELGVPFLVFLGRRARLVAALAFAGLQVLIMLTGNYGFFNVLTVVLTVLLLDDRFLRTVVPAWLRRLAPAPDPDARGLGYRPLWTTPLAAVILAASVGQFRWLAPFNIVNQYGLFAVMTTERPEIVVEGSRDGRVWKPYVFRYKPGPVRRAPPWVAPHQPRLDWQMWFAALGGAETTPWFGNFLLRLLEGSPEVLALLAHNPFPEAPPRYVRAVVYGYRFTRGGPLPPGGAWWRREPQDVYFPAVSLAR